MQDLDLPQNNTNWGNHQDKWNAAFAALKAAIDDIESLAQTASDKAEAASTGMTQKIDKSFLLDENGLVKKVVLPDTEYSEDFENSGTIDAPVLEVKKDTSPVQGSDNAITSDYIFQLEQRLIAAGVNINPAQ